MADVRGEQNLDNRNGSQESELLGIPTDPLLILYEEVARVFQIRHGENLHPAIDEKRTSRFLVLASMLVMFRGATSLKIIAQIRDVVLALCVLTREEESFAHQAAQLQHILDGIMERHEDELALVRQQLADAQHTASRMAADHQVELGRVRSRSEAEAKKLTVRIDELVKSDSGRSVAKLHADKEALRERLQRALDELADLRKGLKGPHKRGEPTTATEITTKEGSVEIDEAETEDELRKKLKALGSSHSKERRLRQEAETAAALAKANFERTEAQLALEKQELERVRKEVLVPGKVNGCGHAQELANLRSQVADLRQELATIHKSIIVPSFTAVQPSQERDSGNNDASLREEIVRLTTNLAEAQEDARRKTAQFNQLRNQPPTRTDPRDEKLKGERDDLRREVDRLEKEAAKLNGIIDSMNTRLVALSGQDSDSDERMENLRTQRDKALAAMGGMENRISELETLLAGRDNDTDDSEVVAAVAELERRLSADAANFAQRFDDINQRIRVLAGKPPLRSAPKNPIKAQGGLIRNEDVERELEGVPRPAFLKARGALLFDRLFRTWGLTLWSVLKRAERARSEFVDQLHQDKLVLRKDAEIVEEFYMLLHEISIWNEDGGVSPDRVMTRIQEIKVTFR